MQQERCDMHQVLQTAKKNSSGDDVQTRTDSQAASKDNTPERLQLKLFGGGHLFTEKA